MGLTVDDLLGRTQDALDDLFRESLPGPIPDGEAKGTAIIAPGTAFSRELAELIHFFAWQGKIFDAAHGFLRNHILPLGLKAIVAKVYPGDSWFDHKPCIVIDYSDTSIVASRIRDEIRLIAPNLYLGNVYWGEKRLINFALEV